MSQMNKGTFPLKNFSGLRPKTDPKMLVWQKTPISKSMTQPPKANQNQFKKDCTAMFKSLLCFTGDANDGTDPLSAGHRVIGLGFTNATLQDEAGRSLALTYVTGSVVRFGAGLANMLLHKPAPSFWIQGPLWLGLTSGAVMGGFLQHYFGEKAFLFPAGAVLILAVLAWVMTMVRPQSEAVFSPTAPQPDAHPDAKPLAAGLGARQGK